MNSDYRKIKEKIKEFEKKSLQRYFYKKKLKEIDNYFKKAVQKIKFRVR